MESTWLCIIAVSSGPLMALRSWRFLSFRWKAGVFSGKVCEVVYNVFPEQFSGRREFFSFFPGKADVALAVWGSDGDQSYVVAAYTMPGDSRSERNAKACTDEFSDGHGTVTFKDDMRYESCHAAVKVGDGTKTGTCFQRDESCFFKFVQIDRRFLGMRISVRHGKHDVFFEESDGVITFDGVDGRREEEIHVVLAGLSRFVALLQDFKADVWMFLAEAGEEGRDDHGSGEEGDRDCQFLGFLGIGQFFLGAVELLHDAVGVAEKDFTISGEYDVSSASGKEGNAQFGLQYFDGMREGRLGNMEGFSSSGEVLEFSSLLEIA